MRLSQKLGLYITILLLCLVFTSGCSQLPLQKPEETPAPPQQTQPQAQLGQNNQGSMMMNTPDMMTRMMSSPENRKAMTQAMSSPQMQPAMMEMMKDPAMQKSMAQMMSKPEMRSAVIQMMADPAMKDTVTAVVKDPRVAPTVKEALGNR